MEFIICIKNFVKIISIIISYIATIHTNKLPQLLPAKYCSTHHDKIIRNCRDRIIILASILIPNLLHQTVQRHLCKPWNSESKESQRYEINLFGLKSTKFGGIFKQVKVFSMDIFSCFCKDRIDKDNEINSNFIYIYISSIVYTVSLYCHDRRSM